MFGHVRPDTNQLEQAEKQRYRAIYCGLCHTLAEKYGFTSRLALTYDLTFLCLLLSSLYEPPETNIFRRCFLHPAKKHLSVYTKYTDYAADITVILAYHKCLDDWNDDKNLLKLGYSRLISDSYKKVKKKRARLCEVVEKELSVVAKAESSGEKNPEVAANACGRILAAVFAPENDIFKTYLEGIGYSIGKYVYIADAFADMKSDIKHKNYNPLLYSSNDTESLRNMLESVLGQGSEAFEMLPLERDENIIKNIFYSGIWAMFDTAAAKEREKHNNDK